MPFVHPAFTWTIPVSLSALYTIGLQQSNIRRIQRALSNAVMKEIRSKHVPRMKRLMPRVKGYTAQSIRVRTQPPAGSRARVQLYCSEQAPYAGFIEWQLPRIGPLRADTMQEFFRRYIDEHGREIRKSPQVRAVVEQAVQREAAMSRPFPERRIGRGGFLYRLTSGSFLRAVRWAVDLIFSD